MTLIFPFTICHPGHSVPRSFFTIIFFVAYTKSLILRILRKYAEQRQGFGLIETYFFIAIYIRNIANRSRDFMLLPPYFEQFFTHKKRKKIPEIGEISQFVRMSVLNMFITSDKIEENEYN